MGFIWYLLLLNSGTAESYVGACNRTVVAGSEMISVRECIEKGPKDACSWAGGRDRPDCEIACSQAKKLFDCDLGAKPKTDCIGAADCQKATRDNNRVAADRDRELNKSAEDGLGNAKKFKQGALEDLHELMSKEDSLLRSGKATPEETQRFQTDKRVVEQVKRDLNDGKPISSEYSGLAATPEVRTKIRAIALFDQSEHAFDEAATFHRERAEQFQQLATQAEANEKGLGTTQKIGEAAKSGKPLSVHPQLEAQASAFVAGSETGQARAQKGEQKQTKSTLSAGDKSMADLDKALNRISNRSLREKLRSKYRDLLKSRGRNSEEVLGELNREIDKIESQVAQDGKNGAIESFLVEAEANKKAGESFSAYKENLFAELSDVELRKSGISPVDAKSLFQQVNEYLTRALASGRLGVPSSVSPVPTS